MSALATTHRDVWGNHLPAEAVTAEEVLEAAGLNWMATLKPIYTKETVVNESFGYASYDKYHEVHDNKAVVRSDTGRHLGVVGNVFRPIDNLELLHFANDLRDSSGADWYGAGPTRGGKDVWALLKLEPLYIGGDEDEGVDRFLMVKNTHDGRGSAQVITHKTRIRCTNALNFTLRNALHRIRVRHTTNWHQRLKEARRALEISFSHDDEFEKAANQLINRRFDTTELIRFVHQLIPDPPQNAQTTDRMLENRQNSRLEIVDILRHGPDLQNIKNTKWGVLNAVAEYSDWHRPVKGNGENRFLRIVNDTNLKTRAFELLTVA